MKASARYQRLAFLTRSHVALRSTSNRVTMKTRKRAAITREMIAGRDMTRRKTDCGAPF